MLDALVKRRENRQLVVMWARERRDARQLEAMRVCERWDVRLFGIMPTALDVRLSFQTGNPVVGGFPTTLDFCVLDRREPQL